MSTQTIAQQRRRIDRGVYGLLLVLGIAFTLILVVIQSGHDEIKRREVLANDYHLLTSKKGLELLGAIDKSKLWFRDLELGDYELYVAHDNESSLLPVYAGIAVRDRASGLKHEINRLVTDIDRIHAQYADTEFNTVTSTLKNTHLKFQANLGKMQSEKAISHRNLDDIVDPLIPVTHQLQRLHQQAYRDVHLSLADFRVHRRVQIIGLVIVLAGLGLLGVVSTLLYVRFALSDLVKAQHSLQESEQYNRMLFEQSPMGLALCRLNGELVDINPAYARIVGRSIEETLALGYWEITSDTHVENEQQQLESLEKTGRYGPYEKEYIHRDGHLVPVRLHGSLVVRDGERLVWSSVEDITRDKWAEAELARYREHLEELVRERTLELRNAQEELVRKERLATLGQLTATVSHELRNPLGAMRPSLYVLEKNSDRNDERVQQALERLDRNIDRCDHIIDELLDFTRITELNRRAVRVDEWLESVIDEQDIPGDIRVEKNLSLNDVELAVDAGRLRRAVINVVENACHAMLEDDSRERAGKGSRMGIKTGGNDKRIEIVITDNGPGMPEDTLGKIFEPLFSTRNFGVGLGMPTVKKIMEQHRGGVEITTAAGHGSSITLWLPRETAGLDSKEVAA